MTNRHFFAETYGCSANFFDFEVILGILHKRGFSLVDNIDEAAFIIINTCGVKKTTEDRMLYRIQQLSKMNKPLIITGCLPRIVCDKIIKKANNFSALLDPQSLEKIGEAVDNALSGIKRKIYFSKESSNKLLLNRVTLNPLVEVIQIAEGCLGKCSYCCTKQARGLLQSYSQDIIMKSVADSIANGVYEIRLSSQDLAIYGFDCDTTIIELLRKILNLSGEFKIRLGMMNPQSILDKIDELTEILNHSKLYKFIHIPVQSGSDKVLHDMKRTYTQKDFIELVLKLREKVPNVMIATDIIVGFPTETEKDFNDTITLLNKCKPDLVNLSKYRHRPNTYASSIWNELPTSTISVRSKIIAKLGRKHSIDNNFRMLGKKIESYIIDVSTKGGLICRAYNYKRVVLENSESKAKLGDKVYLKIIDANDKFLTGRLII